MSENEESLIRLIRSCDDPSMAIETAISVLVAFLGQLQEAEELPAVGQ